MRISDWSSDVCSSDLGGTRRNAQRKIADWSIARIALADRTVEREIGRRFGEIDIDRTRSDKPLENGHVAGRFLVDHRREEITIVMAGDRKSTRLNSSH